MSITAWILAANLRVFFSEWWVRFLSCICSVPYQTGESGTKPFLRWGQAQECSPDTPGISKNASGAPLAFTLTGVPQAINLAPLRRVRAWGLGNMSFFATCYPTLIITIGFFQLFFFFLNPLHCPQIDAQILWNLIGASGMNAKLYSISFPNFWGNELYHNAAFLTDSAQVTLICCSVDKTWNKVHMWN